MEFNQCCWVYNVIFDKVAYLICVYKFWTNSEGSFRVVFTKRIIGFWFDGASLLYSLHRSESFTIIKGKVEWESRSEGGGCEHDGRVQWSDSSPSQLRGRWLRSRWLRTRRVVIIIKRSHERDEEIPEQYKYLSSPFLNQFHSTFLYYLAWEFGNWRKIT